MPSDDTATSISTSTCTGDAAMDPHHTVEDVGIALGMAIRQALGIAKPASPGIGHAYAPLDEALARVVIDCSGRPFLHFEAAMPEPVIGLDFAASLVEEFWRALVVNAGLTCHIDLIRARNAHHAAEAIFKAGALALRDATRITGDPATFRRRREFSHDRHYRLWSRQSPLDQPRIAGRR